MPREDREMSSRRLWSCVVSSEFRHPLWGRIKVTFRFLELINILVFTTGIAAFIRSIDLLDVGTSFVTSDAGIALRTLRVLRFFNLLDAPLIRAGLEMMGRVVFKHWRDLTVVFILTIVAITIGGLVMFLLEGYACYDPDSASISTTDWTALVFPCNPNYSNMPLSMYWAVITLTTVGCECKVK